MEKIGEGGEAEVFALDRDRVLRLWRSDHPSIDRRVELTREVAAGAGHLNFAVPEILDDGYDAEGRRYFVERRLEGISMSERLPAVTGPARTALLDSYLDTSLEIRQIELERPWFGELIGNDPIRTESWSDYLGRTLDRQLGQLDPADPVLASGELDDAATSVRRWIVAAERSTAPRRVVHFDYFPGNVLCVGSTITAVIDWSVLTIVGDPDLDVALAASYLGVVDAVTDDDHAHAAAWLRDRELLDAATALARWGAAWWLPIRDDGRIRPWVSAVLGLSPG